MVDALKIHPKELQHIFSEVYKKYFNSHDLILSSNAVLTWGPDISHWVSAIKIKQKVPVRTFCWVNFNTSGRITFQTVFKYSTVIHDFENETFRSMYLDDFERMERFIQDFLVKNRYYWGLEIDFLTEAPKGHGFAFSGVISVLLAHLIYMAIWKIDGESLEDGWLSKDHPLFEEIYALSIELSNCISEGKSIGASNYVAMLPNSSAPVVFITEKNGLQPEVHPKIQKNEICNSGQSNPVRETLYRGGLTEFLGISHMENAKIPIDYGVIFTGVEYEFDDMETVQGAIQYQKNHLQEFIRRTINALPANEKNPQSATLQHILNLDETHIFQDHIDGMNMRILEGFDRMYANGFNDRSVSAFISTIQSAGYASFSYQEQNTFFQSIQHLFHEFRLFEEEELGMLPFNIGKLWGSFLFVIKHRNSRATLEKVLTRLRDQGHPVSLDYASWRDGLASDGVQAEQFISKNLFSKYTSNSNVQFSDSNGVRYCWDYKEILEKETDAILLDTIKRRVYMKGTKLTSKDIHSQNTTIDMMTLVMKHLGETVSNKELPISTYSQNKNEILSKVILPIKRLTKEYYDKKLLLTCSGWITDYYLRLERDPSIRIGIISKIGS